MGPASLEPWSLKRPERALARSFGTAGPTTLPALVTSAR
jgi:hypothetical protein